MHFAYVGRQWSYVLHESELAHNQHTGTQQTCTCDHRTVWEGFFQVTLSPSAEKVSRITWAHPPHFPPTCEARGTFVGSIMPPHTQVASTQPGQSSSRGLSMAVGHLPASSINGRVAFSLLCLLDLQPWLLVKIWLSYTDTQLLHMTAGMHDLACQSR